MSNLESALGDGNDTPGGKNPYDGPWGHIYAKWDAVPDVIALRADLRVLGERDQYAAETYGSMMHELGAAGGSIALSVATGAGWNPRLAPDIRLRALKAGAPDAHAREERALKSKREKRHAEHMAKPPSNPTEQR